MAKEKQSAKTVERDLLRDLRELTSRQFVYEDGWCGMVPFHRKLTEMQTGPPVPFAELTWREQADVLRSFIPWSRYPEPAWNDEYTIRDNIEAGKKPDQWLEGTSIGESFRLIAEGKTPFAPAKAPEMTWDDVRAALGIPAPKGKDAHEGKTLRELMESVEQEPEKEKTQERGGREM